MTQHTDADRILMACLDQAGMTAEQLATVAGLPGITAHLEISRMLRDGYMRHPETGDAALITLTQRGRDHATLLRCRRHDEARAALVNSFQ